MARSSYIYVVKWRGLLRAPFTVKHEAQDWLRREHSNELRDIIVTTFRDGTGEWVGSKTGEEFLA